MPVTSKDIATFLRTNVFIKRLNFKFRSYKVYPSAYQTDVADAIAAGAIKLGNGVSPGAGASYNFGFDRLELSKSFSLTNARDQGFLIHECTHAHLDIQGFGSHSGHENEAVGYLAEAVFLEAAGSLPLGTEKIRMLAHGMAKYILSNRYEVPKADADDLVNEVKADPHYAGSAVYMSNGFHRSLLYKIFR